MVATRITLSEIVRTFEDLQDQLTEGLELLDGKARFTEDRWVREKGGGGRTRVIQGGNLLEKGGIAFSHIFGQMPEELARTFQLQGGESFDATGISVDLHPVNPFVPMIHMDTRFYCVEGGKSWFNGSIELSPVYVDAEEALHYHEALRKVCERFAPDFYPNFKRACDDYYYIQHRKETRGIGGLVFRSLNGSNPEEKQFHFEFVRAIGQAFLPIFSEMSARSRHKTYSDREKRFQMLRRARYAEFNLIYDQHTRVWLQAGNRTESILMAMPPAANWEYAFKAEPGSAEAFTQNHLQPHNWLDQ